MSYSVIVIVLTDLEYSEVIFRFVWIWSLVSWFERPKHPQTIPKRPCAGACAEAVANVIWKIWLDLSWKATAALPPVSDWLCYWKMRRCDSLTEFSELQQECLVCSADLLGFSFEFWDAKCLRLLQAAWCGSRVPNPPNIQHRFNTGFIPPHID